MAFARFGLVPSVGGYETTFKQRTGERRYPFWRLTLCNVSPWSPLDWDRGVEQQLQARVTGDIVWAPIKSHRGDRCHPAGLRLLRARLRELLGRHRRAGAQHRGPRMRPHDGRAIPTFLRQALTDKPLTVFGDGSQTRSFCYVDDLIRGLVLARGVGASTSRSTSATRTR